MISNKNFYPEQYKSDDQYPINHNYLHDQFKDIDVILDKVKSVAEKGDFTLGSAVDHFEKSFAEKNGAKYGIGVGSGTDALFLSLKALGIGIGDEVITTPYTFFATIGAIVTAGASPVFIDIDQSYNIDSSKIESAITSKTKAIMPVHWAGVPCNMDEINLIAEKHSLHVVADACHAIMSRYKGKGIASCATTSCFSMHPLKNLNVWGDGGIILTNDKSLADKLSKIRNHGLTDRDHCEKWSYNSRLDTIQAVIAQHLLDYKINNITNSRISNAKYLDNALSSLSQVVIPPRDADLKSVFHLYIATYHNRDRLKDFLNKKGVDAKVHYPVPMHLQPAAKDLGHSVGDFPITESVCSNCLSLPIHEFITKDDLDHMIRCIKEFYANE